MMRISAAFLPAEIAPHDLGRQTVIAIDCFRASTSIVAALAAGAAAVYPFLTVEEARLAAGRMPGAVLAGERGGARIEGFDLGNSPSQFTKETVGGRNVVLTTTNGTRLLLAVAGGHSVLVGCFVNASATVEAAVKAGRDILLAAAGTEDQFSIEDSLCAGLIAEAIRSRCDAQLDDAAEFAVLAYRAARTDLPAAALRGRGAKNVLALELGDDLRYSLNVDSLPVVAGVLVEPLRIVSA